MAVLAEIGLVAAWAQGATSASIYTCIDRNGRRLTADRPIPECLDREQRELNPSGTVRRQVGPALSDLEKAELEAKRRQEAEDKARAVEDRRRERALVTRYPNKAVHDAERLHAIQAVDDIVAIAEARIEELRKQRKALDTEMEFYQRDPGKAPLLLKRRIADNSAALEEQRRFIDKQQQEKQRIHQRFDAELASLEALWEAQRNLSVVPPAPSSATRRP